MNKNEQTIAVGLGADSTKIERDFWGRRLFFAAWAFEILAVTIGIIIAWAQTVDAASSGNVNTVDLWLAPLPFVMVAAVELLKIPFAYLVYINRHTVTRIVFSSCLLAISFLTFERLINGLERQFNSITLKVDVPRIALEDSRSEIRQSEVRVHKLKSLLMDDIYTEEQERLDSAGEAYKKALFALDAEIEIHVGGASKIPILERKILIILQELSQIEIDKESELGAISKEYKEKKKNIEALEERIDRVLYKPLNLSKTFKALEVVYDKKVRIASKQKPESKNILFENLHVLVAEDNSINQKLIKNVLNGFGLEVTLAGNGEEAVNLRMQNEFDMIFMDIQMPVLCGEESMKKIIKYENKKNSYAIRYAFTS